MAVSINGTTGIITPSPVVLNGSTSGTITLAAPAVAGSNTITFPAGTGTVSVNGVSSNIVSGTAVASTSGTSIDFTGIPSWVKRITVMLNGVKTSGTADFLLQTGAGSVTTTGYLGASTRIIAATPVTSNYTTGFGINIGGGTNTNVHHGAYVLSLVGSNIWVCTGLFGFSNTNATANSIGSITLSGTLDRVRMTTLNGTDTFTAGNINILWE